MKKWIIVLVIVILIAAATAYFFGPYRNQSNTAAGDMQTVPAEMGDLTSTIGATGVVRADQTAILLWQTSGTVDIVNIQVGEAVTRGQILAALEQTSLPQNVIMAQADLVSAQKALDDLLNSQLQQALALQAVEDAEQALEDAQNPELAQARALEAIAQAEKALENAERSTRWAKSPASQSFIDEAEAELTLAKDRLDKAYDKYKPYQGRPEDNVTRAVLLAEYSAAKQVYDAAVRKLNSLQGTASITDIAVQEANLATAKAQLLEAQRDWERVKDGPTDADIKLFEAQLEDAKREYERIKDGPDPDDIAVAEARVAAEIRYRQEHQLSV
jgi:HlyD family secretion protein